MVFAHLVHTQLEPLLEFLCSLPGPTGKPALEFVMAEWTSRQHLFYGQYEGKVRWASSRCSWSCRLLRPDAAPLYPDGRRLVGLSGRDLLHGPHQLEASSLTSLPRLALCPAHLPAAWGSPTWALLSRQSLGRGARLRVALGGG